MADELLFKYKEIVNVNNVTSIIRKEVGRKFLRVLEDAGSLNGTNKDKRPLNALSKVYDIKIHKLLRNF